MRSKANLLVIFITLLVAGPVFARTGTTEVNGSVEDLDGNPVPGAEVTVTSVTSSQTSYTVKTNKKGKYFIPAVLYYEPGEWFVTLKAEGYSPSKIKVESRKSDRTLVGDIYETGMSAEKPPRVLLKAFGKARIDFVMISQKQAAEQEQRRLEEAKAKLEAEGKLPTADPLGLASNKVADGDLEGSLEFFQQALEEQPEDPERRELFAKVLFNLERYEEASAVAAEARDLAPDLPGIDLLVADIQMKLGAYDEAREALEKQATLTPEDVGVFQRLAWVAEREGNPDAAIAANESIVALEPDNVEAWLVLGGLYAEKGLNEKSEQAFTRVVELDPTNAYKTFFNIGVLIENRPNASEAEERRALEAFRKAVEIKPDYAKGHRHLAYAMLRSGDLKGARAELQRYLELEPNAADASDVQALVTSLPK